MALRNDSLHWGTVAKTLHWLMALLVITAATIGWIMLTLDNSPTKVKIYSVHKSIGITVLALVLMRLVWRAFDQPPLPIMSIPRWQRIAAISVHVLLYLLMLAIPLSGWVFNSASNFPLQWFGLFHLPNITGGANPELKAFARAAHYWLFWILVLAFCMHVAAALKHHFVDKDTVLLRMLPRRATTLSSADHVIKTPHLPPEA